MHVGKFANVGSFLVAENTRDRPMPEKELVGEDSAATALGDITDSRRQALRK